ncbi:hypothetical protein [Paenarthrobacter sp. AB444]|uniref:hypothetical protein n=1 Tax=Paenarthrobacter sp. AB444 TaxID=3025681 RepID=UPI003FD0A0D1
MGNFQLTATGVESHAGRDPTVGASAVHVIAEIITAVTRVADLSKGTSICLRLVRNADHAIRQAVARGDRAQGSRARVRTYPNCSGRRWFCWCSSLR